ncbi:MAG: response regulator [Chloroflexales bacterium]
MATRIMVIDDEPLIGRLLEYQLGGVGYVVTAYTRAHDALGELAHTQPDLILLDVMMPELSGWDVCSQIRRSSSVPIIMLTAKDGDDDVVRGLTGGADDYVGKPFTQAQLVARIEAVLRRSRGTRASAPPHMPKIPVAPAPVVAPPKPIATALDSPAPARVQLPRLGPRLAEARLQRGLTLHEIGRVSGVRWEFLQALEQEAFGSVPRSELRLALRTYSTLLNIDLAPYTRRRLRQTRPLLSRLGMVALIVVLLLILVALVL